MSVKGIARRAAANGVGTPTTAPIYVDSATNTLKYIPTGSGTTTVEILDASSTQALTNKSLAAPVITGAATVAVAAATLSLTNPLHAGRIVLISALAGCVVTLPAATGSGDTYVIKRSVAATSVGDVFKVANANDYMRGSIQAVAKDDGVLVQFATLNTGTVATESDTMTWNFTTSGISDVGDYVEFTDSIAHVWTVWAAYTDNGTEVTPFSAGV